MGMVKDRRNTMTVEDFRVGDFPKGTRFSVRTLRDAYGSVRERAIFVSCACQKCGEKWWAEFPPHEVNREALAWAGEGSAGARYVDPERDKFNPDTGQRIIPAQWVCPDCGAMAGEPACWSEEGEA